MIILQTGKFKKLQSKTQECYKEYIQALEKFNKSNEEAEQLNKIQHDLINLHFLTQEEHFKKRNNLKQVLKSRRQTYNKYLNIHIEYHKIKSESDKNILDLESHEELLEVQEALNKARTDFWISLFQAEIEIQQVYFDKFEELMQRNNIKHQKTSFTYIIGDISIHIIICFTINIFLIKINIIINNHNK